MVRNYGIAIGINRYDNLQPLKCAQRDSTAMVEFFHATLACSSDSICHFAEGVSRIEPDHGPSFSSRPTFGTLMRFLRTRFEAPFLKAGDNLWFFFAGHGICYEDRDYLMPIDADPGDVQRTAISVRHITERLQRCGADNIVMLIDACRTASRTGIGIGNETQRGIVTLFSCSPRERSYEIEQPPIQHGSFTYALIQGLQLQGEGNCATVERLYLYLRNKVPALNKRYQKPAQTPYAVIEPASKYHLILLPRTATVQDVAALKLDAYRAERDGNNELAEQLWIRVSMASPADQDAIAGIRRTDPKIPPTSINTLIPGVKSASDDSAVASLTSSPLQADKHPSRPGASTLRFRAVQVNGRGQKLIQHQKEAEYFQEDLGQSIVLPLIKVPSGVFMMGSSNSEAAHFQREGPQHQVDIPSFWMGQYPITQAQWRTIASIPKVKLDLASEPAHFRGSNRPVERVSWYDAMEFCARLSQQTGRHYRLPSEAEWEYACRAGTEMPFHFGETITPELANYDSNYSYHGGPTGKPRKETTDVDRFEVANGFGLYDMHGNVWEWCTDHWHDNYKEAPSDGTAWTIGGSDSLRILRGGSWNRKPMYCRSAYRYKTLSENRVNYVGFRVVCTLSREVGQ